MTSAQQDISDQLAELVQRMPEDQARNVLDYASYLVDRADRDDDLNLPTPSKSPLRINYLLWIVPYTVSVLCAAFGFGLLISMASPNAVIWDEHLPLRLKFSMVVFLASVVTLPLLILWRKTMSRLDKWYQWPIAVLISLVGVGALTVHYSMAW